MKSVIGFLLRLHYDFYSIRYCRIAIYKTIMAINSDMRYSSLLWLLLAILTMTAEVTSAAPAPKKKSTLSLKVPFLLKGERLPITTLSDSTYIRNERWREYARALRVRDLRVYDWPYAYNVAGGAERQKRKTVADLKAVGYKVETVTWHEYEGSYPPPLSGFRAKRGKEVISALWSNNGSHLFLYWGHEVLLTPEIKRDDELIQAVAEGNTDEVEIALKRGANPRAMDYSGDSILVIAAALQHAKIVRQLLEARKANSDHARSGHTSSDDIASAMNIAASRDDVTTLQTLLDSGVTSSQIGNALQIAASGGAENTAKLLAPRAPRESVGKALVTAALVEIWRGSSIQYPAIVELLIPHHPPQSALDAALVSAAEDDDANIVPLLLAAGANVEAQNSRGETALMRAAADPYYSGTQPALEALLNVGANPNVRDKSGNTALFIAVAQNGSQTVELLLKHGADPKIRNKNGQTAVDWAQMLSKTSEKHRQNEYLAIAQILRAAQAQDSKPE